jgi:hypothetical protein
MALMGQRRQRHVKPLLFNKMAMASAAHAQG